MEFLEGVLARAQATPMRVAFSEGEDETMMRAAAEAVRLGIARAILVGDEQNLRALAAERGIAPETFEYEDMADVSGLEALADACVATEGCTLTRKGVMRRAKTNPLVRALTLEAAGRADITFAGTVTSTGDVLAAAQQIIGLAPGIATPSSVAFFDVMGYSGSEGTLVAFGDSAVCLDPTAEQLASIAVSCCDTVADVAGWEPRCALISHSTCGSAQNELTEKVVAAVDLAQAARPDLAIDGEFQLDAALMPRVAERKVGRRSAVAGRANVLIWPDLDAGNIFVKTVQAFSAGATVYGPLLQGFRKVVCDCSRNATVDDIVGNVAISVVRAGALAERGKEMA